MFANLLAIATLAAAISAQTTNVTIAEVEQAFTADKIVPDVIPTFEPTGLLDVVFFNNVTNTNTTVTPGLNMTRQQNALPPALSLTSNDTSLANRTFVLIMVDPDAPTPQNATLADVRHFLAPNLTLSGSLADGARLVNNTPAISSFERPTPPAGSDPHRYTLLLFVQPSKFSRIAPTLVNASTSILNFNLSSFMAQTGLGSPVAGNFFLTGPDNSTSSTGTSSASAATSTSTRPSSASASGSASATGATRSSSPSTNASNSASITTGLGELRAVGLSFVMCIFGMLAL